MSTFGVGLVLAFWIILGLISDNEDNINDPPRINIKNGIIEGRIALTPNLNQTYYSFQKIPFAKPPINQLRFKPPQPADNWNGILETTKMDVVCYQMPHDSELESEDCLYLNVYTPIIPSKNTKLLPVMFYIYGGGFIEGNTLEENYGPDFFIEKNVILVLPNYRVGPFGFLSTGDLHAPGNMGLKDQHMALKWTQENVRKFGGDPEKVTIFGQSAGAASVTYQTLYAPNAGLFRAAIGQSGTFLCPWAFQRAAPAYARQLVDFVGGFDGGDESAELMRFLMELDAKEIDRASLTLAMTERIQNRQMYQGFFFASVIEPDHDEAFLTEKMYQKLKNGDFLQVPTLIGINSEEMIFFGHPTYAAGFVAFRLAYDTYLDWAVPNDMLISDLDTKIVMGSKIRDIYTNGSTYSSHAGNTIRLVSDNCFTRSVIKHAELQSNYTDVYFYEFTYKGKLGNYDFPVEGAETVTHGEELNYMWLVNTDSFTNRNLSEFPTDDVNIMEKVLTIWTNFATHLNPTPDVSPVLDNIEWPKVNQYGPGTFSYIDITTVLTQKNQPKPNTYRQWVELYDSLGYDDFDTY